MKEDNYQNSTNNSNSLHLIWYKRVFKQVIALKTFYLLCFVVGIVVPTWLNLDSDGVKQQLIAVVFLGIAILVKMWIMSREISLKQFLKLQFGFIIPYCFVGINIYLYIKSQAPLKQHQDLYNYSQQAVKLQCAIFFLQALIASLISTIKTTSRLQYWIFILTFVYFTGLQVYFLTQIIDNFDETLDDLNDQVVSNLTYYSNMTPPNQTAFDNFQENYQNISEISQSLELMKDYNIALIASLIAELLIIMDLIARPIQKMEIHEEINEDFQSRVQFDIKTRRETQLQYLTEINGESGRNLDRKFNQKVGKNKSQLQYVSNSSYIQDQHFQKSGQRKTNLL